MADAVVGGVSDFHSFEEFLDSQVAPIDLFYLEDEEVARQLVELGYRGNGEAVKREDFQARKAAAEALKNAKASTESKPLAGAHKDLKKTPLISALVEREEANRAGRLAVRLFRMIEVSQGQTVIFIRHRNAKGQEVSGYIDFAQRLQFEEIEQYFIGQKLLVPRHTDLSFYNWETQTSKLASSAAFEVVTDAFHGLLLKCKADRKVINVDPKKPPGDNTTRTTITDSDYIQVVLYDHTIRQKP